MASVLKFLVSFAIVLHCTGVTQYISAHAENKSSFVSMLSMTEEETKKEKEAKDDSNDSKDLFSKHLLAELHLITEQSFILFLSAKDRLIKQYNAECPTPPPDFTA